MTKPYLVMQLKADLSLDDCVNFLNVVTDEGKKSFRNIFVALPFSRLKEMNEKFSSSGIHFGTIEFPLSDESSFTKTIGAKLVHEVKGQFALIGTQEERSVLGLSNEQLLNKLVASEQGSLKVFFCIPEIDENEIREQLELLKQSHALDKDPHPIVIFQPEVTAFKNYLPSPEELQALFEKASNLLNEIFGDDASKISLLVQLPNDLVGFSELLEKNPFHGAYFIKSGVYPHAVHKENVQLFHVHTEETDKI